VPVEGVELGAPDSIGLNGRPYPLPRTEPRRQTATDAQGRFQFIGVPEGYFHLRCGGDWYADTVYELYTTRDPAIRIVVQRRSTIRITLLRESGAPFEGEATIELYPVRGAGGYGGDNTGTFKNGVWEWPHIPAGEYIIDVQLSGILSEDNASRQRFTLEAAGIAEVTLRYPQKP
jgi:hypothetical protein